MTNWKEIPKEEFLDFLEYRLGFKKGMFLISAYSGVIQKIYEDNWRDIVQVDSNGYTYNRICISYNEYISIPINEHTAALNDHDRLEYLKNNQPIYLKHVFDMYCDINISSEEPKL